MNIRLRAFLYAVGIFAALLVTGFVLLTVGQMIPREYHFAIFVAVYTVVFVFGGIYSICRAQLEADEMIRNKRKT